MKIEYLLHFSNNSSLQDSITEDLEEVGRGFSRLLNFKRIIYKFEQEWERNTITLAEGNSILLASELELVSGIDIAGSRPSHHILSEDIGGYNNQEMHQRHTIGFPLDVPGLGVSAGGLDDLIILVDDSLKKR